MSPPSPPEVMRYVDHEPGAWFAVEHRDELYLDARYAYSALIDDSVLVRLDESELEAYRAGGHAYLSDLTRRIHDSAPYQESSPYYRRNLYRGADGAQYRDAVAAAITEHTWAAEHGREDP